MYGLGVLKGMAVTFKNFLETYTKKDGIFTVQYPEERLPEKERFRNFPILVKDNSPSEDLRCVACDICAKECPPKCITIVMDKDEQGRPLKRPKEFDIDVSICMSCGICEEVCPFDAIFMDHEFELAEYDRMDSLVYNQEKLTRPLEHFAKIRPTDYARIEAERKAKRDAEEARKKAAQEASQKTQS